LKIKTNKNTIEQLEDKIRSDSKIVLPEKYDFLVEYFTTIVDFVKNEGLWIETGVYRGRSIQFLSTLTDNIIYGFDSFCGLPEDWTVGNPKGCYNAGGEIPPGAIIGDNQSMYDDSVTKNWEPWNKNVKLIKGLVQDTLPKFVKKYNKNIAFLHIDTDIYSACSFTLTCLSDRIVDGTVIAFDDLFWPGEDYKNGELKAFCEFLNQTDLDFEPLVLHGSENNFQRATIRIIKK